MVEPRPHLDAAVWQLLGEVFRHPQGGAHAHLELRLHQVATKVDDTGQLGDTMSCFRLLISADSMAEALVDDDIPH